MDIKLLKSVFGVVAPSGSEENLHDIIINEIKQYVDEINTDILGNIIAHKKGNGKKMMLVAHMDTVGMMISFIDDFGFLRFSALGKIEPSQAVSKMVAFKNGISGVVCCEEIENPKEMVLNNLYIDIGAKTKEEALKYVSIGDTCSFCSETIVDDMKVISPALGRVSAIALIEAIKNIKNSPYDIYYVFSVQKELALRGANNAAYTVEPDFCISVDVTPAYDIPTLITQKMPVKLGRGAAIKIKDSSLLCTPKMIDAIKKCANESNIKFQMEITDSYGSDLGQVNISKGGVASGAVSIPIRYLGSTGQLCLIEDYEECVKLVCAVTNNKVFAEL